MDNRNKIFSDNKDYLLKEYDFDLDFSDVTLDNYDFSLKMNTDSSVDISPAFLDDETRELKDNLIEVQKTISPLVIENPLEQLNSWLSLTVSKGVSDLHLVEGIEPIFRLNGELLPIEGSTILYSDTITKMGRTICNDSQWDEFLTNGEVDLAYELESVARFRVNIFKQMDTTAIAFRRIPIEIPSINSLGVPDVLKELIHKSQGLFLVTGPTGSGKTTTLAALIDYLNETKKAHILTLEDPIEYVHKHKRSIISQREIGRDTESFGNALRAALRQDPDVILVGEMRDFETISIALTAAETGHLVLGTLHTSSAPATIERIVDVFPAVQQPQIRSQLSGALIGILSQRLLPTKDGKGRLAATEMLVNTKGIANIIRSGKIHQISNMLQMGKSEGMHTMAASIDKLIQSQKVDVAVAESFIEKGSEM
ncbi:type IV pilus twitching motility protein PilT [Enterococcus faecalis]|uniref:type IV pilus twitching motility protein PilT n=1 Tax=Enterococcus faecalis TaxID=1351 RepID=UPI001A050457|nr:type IV pilus twitching motility protein PilT [Enterococcus faecalis]EGO6705175.1 type IV pilus twitching motility protein PilT [Enterococcus faecalis]